MLGGLIMEKVSKHHFLSECTDIVERGRASNIEITEIRIEGVYKEEIFRIAYVPKEEGYEEGPTVRSSTE